MIQIAVLGCGRIGRMHAANIAAHPRAGLAMVHDLHAPAAEAVAAEHGVATGSAEDAFGPGIDAVLVATATETHADFIERAVAAGKPILCEKPIDLDPARVARCAAAIAGTRVPVQIGFNRRFDPGHRAARDALRDGEIGALQQVVITSRDPAMPPRAYYAAAGGLLRDMTIHDFDLARFMLAEEPAEIFATAGRLTDPALMEELDDHDSAMIVMRTGSGRQCHINNARCAVYGYDQRVELLGDGGMLISGNRKPHEMRRYTAAQAEGAAPYEFFFAERYAEAFRAQLDAFFDSIETGAPVQASFEDGQRALLLAEAAYRSLREGRMVRIEEGAP